MDYFKNRIRDLREDMDLRQIDVSKATGIDQKTLSNYETGKTNPDSYSLIRLADFFHVTIDYLVGYSDSNLMTNQDILKKLSEMEKCISELKRIFQSKWKMKAYVFNYFEKLE